MVRVGPRAGGQIVPADLLRRAAVKIKPKPIKMLMLLKQTGVLDLPLPRASRVPHAEGRPLAESG